MTMKIWMRSTAALIAFAGMVLMAPHAYAGCGAEGMNSGAMKPAVFLQGGSSGLVLAHFVEPGDPFGGAPITGLWKFTFTAKGNGANGPPDYTPIDAGFVVWHDDGTEIMNSGRAPVTGSFCLGVWKRVDESTYHLNHWALSWVPGYVPGATQSWSSGLNPPAPPGTTPEDEAFQPTGPTNIQETVILDRDGDHYSGTFRLTQYLYDGVNVTDAVSVKQVVVGTISATRITVE
jgi:hypothetical protein